MPGQARLSCGRDRWYTGDFVSGFALVTSGLAASRMLPILEHVDGEGLPRLFAHAPQIAAQHRRVRAWQLSAVDDLWTVLAGKGERPALLGADAQGGGAVLLLKARQPGPLAARVCLDTARLGVPHRRTLGGGPHPREDEPVPSRPRGRRGRSDRVASGVGRPRRARTRRNR